ACPPFMVRLFRVFVPTTVLTLIVSEILLAFACYIVAAALLFPADFDIFLLYDDGLARIAIIVLILVLALYSQDLYTDLRVRHKTFLIQSLVMTIGIAFIAQAALGYLSPELTVPRSIMLSGSLLAILV